MKTFAKQKTENQNAVKSTTGIGLVAAALMLVFSPALARQQSYDDVAVIINQNSSVSETIGTYFASQRLIPSGNLIRISVPATEEIDSVTFENLRSQVEAGLNDRNIVRNINYLVTTKGMPLKVNRGGIGTYQSSSSSVESELALILGPYATSIGLPSRVQSPFYHAKEDFNRKKFGIFLVTRLDGFTVSDVMALIDRSAGIDSTLIQQNAFLFDQDPLWGENMYLNTNMRSAETSLRARNCIVNFDSSSIYQTRQHAVLGYVSWGSNDKSAYLYAEQAKPNHDFQSHSIAETYVSTSGRSFETPPQYGQSLVADLIAEGICGAKGYVYEPYSSAIASVQDLFPMYADGFTMAEAYASASLYLSWMDVVIGDPKMRLVSTRLPKDNSGSTKSNNPGALPVQLTNFRGTETPAGVQISWTTATETRNAGFDLQRRMIGDLGFGTGVSNSNLTTQNSNLHWTSLSFLPGFGSTSLSHEYTFTDRNLPSGTYAYRLRQIDNDGSEHFSQEISVVIAPAGNAALRTYPNPFNPATTIQVALPNPGRVSLKVYNVAGQEVAVLLDGFAEAGTLSVPFDASRLSSGVYFSRLITERATLSQKLILAR